MKTKLFIKVIVVIFVLFVSTTNLTTVYSRTIRVSLNGIYLTFTDPPILRAGRVLVPLRVTAEALGLRVSWANNILTLTDRDRVITLTPGTTRASIGSIEITLDSPSEIIRGRTFIPLRFISEVLGATVVWRERQSTVVITTDRQINITAPVREPLSSDLVSRDGRRLFIGMDRNSLLQITGQPVFSGVTLTGSMTYIFRDNSNQIMAASIIDNRAVSIYSNQSNWGLSGAFPDTSMTEIATAFNFQENIQVRIPIFESVPVLTDISQSREEISLTPTAFINNIIITFFRDAQANSLRGIRIGNTTYSAGIHPWRQRWAVGLPPRPTLPSNVTPQQAALNAEIIMAYHLNSIRARARLPLLAVDGQLSDLARAHSIDMFTNNFYSHTSPTTGTLQARIQNSGIFSRTGGGENLTQDGVDPIRASYSLYYSPGHRTNILLDFYTHIGIGVSDVFYTQKFIGR